MIAITTNSSINVKDFRATADFMQTSLMFRYVPFLYGKLY